MRKKAKVSKSIFVRTKTKGAEGGRADHFCGGKKQYHFKNFHREEGRTEVVPKHRA